MLNNSNMHGPFSFLDRFQKKKSLLDMWPENVSIVCSTFTTPTEVNESNVILISWRRKMHGTKGSHQMDPSFGAPKRDGGTSRNPISS